MGENVVRRRVKPPTPTTSNLELIVVRESQTEADENPEDAAEEAFDRRRRGEVNLLIPHDAEHRGSRPNMRSSPDMHSSPAVPTGAPAGYSPSNKVQHIAESP